MEIYPSIISSDILSLRSVLKLLDPHCHGYHIDIMDDHFVPNLTFGPAFIKAIRRETILPLHVHLMVDNIFDWVGRILLKKDDLFIFHIEAVLEEDVVDLVESIKGTGCKVGIAINPETSIDILSSYLHLLDHILVMSVNPGFSGQPFLPSVIEKVTALTTKREEYNVNFTIGMDGGIGPENIKMLAEKGVEQVGAASSIFGESDSVLAIKKLYEMAG
jgi:ribulose-phosphate 3-epimerase